MFAICPKINFRRCGFAGFSKNDLHCGLMSGPEEASKVSNLFKCTKDMTKAEVKKHANGFTPKFS